MPDLNPHCRAKGCPAPPTHVLLAHTHDWNREAVPADQAPDIVTNNMVEIRTPGLVEHGKPKAYYCLAHAKQRETR